MIYADDQEYWKRVYMNYIFGPDFSHFHPFVGFPCQVVVVVVVVVWLSLTGCPRSLDVILVFVLDLSLDCWYY